MNKSQRGHPSPRESFTSSSTDTSKFNSGFLTAASLSSVDHDLSSSSAVHFLNETHDFDIIDSLNYDDVDETVLGKESQSDIHTK
ncbi:hypothetical protein G6F57_013955 [Rhizopus arrhizus]|uniref:Uncharacterized protein n=1 Tax=Rhizopus oryzae TaxID=64495 RepID=A0A9P6X9Z0_RHIOR|nr:hypothetical protein G6F23_013053 [Rhizopus arrhizus]KAG1396596.1 hypothetical protein G6F58_011705 [Rhizopus delemar]KAG0819340.1 hypothetical protein G6F19_012601 [Rhizopus arrhizus]KAG0820534.1 hypothetical protein G6F18_012585 [Rhizopus arrhizus]KAG0849671.1 hypothetical protein G6F17_010562 [Rhizopus arrhizus]